MSAERACDHISLLSEGSSQQCQAGKHAHAQLGQEESLRERLPQGDDHTITNITGNHHDYNTTTINDNATLNETVTNQR